MIGIIIICAAVCFILCLYKWLSYKNFFKTSGYTKMGTDGQVKYAALSGVSYQDADGKSCTGPSTLEPGVSGGVDVEAQNLPEDVKFPTFQGSIEMVRAYIRSLSD
jgi:hypothetical protein